MGVASFRNDAILADACRSDVDKFCSKTPAGGLAAGPSASTVHAEQQLNTKLGPSHCVMRSTRQGVC